MRIAVTFCKSFILQGITAFYFGAWAKLHLLDWLI